MPARSLARCLVCLLLAPIACEREDVERSAEVVEEKFEQVSDQLEGAGAKIEQSGREGLQQASEGLDKWLAQNSATRSDEYQPIAGASEGIACESDERCTMSATFIDQLARDPTVLAGEAVVALSQASAGKGLLLSRVRPGSIPDLLGLRDGDLLISLNGTDLASLEAPRALAAALKGTNQATLVTERGGQRRTLLIVRKK